MNPSSFGAQLRAARISQHGESLRAFCAMTDVDPGNWSRLERGDTAPPVGVDALDRLRKALGLGVTSESWGALRDAAAIDAGRFPSDLTDPSYRERWVTAVRWVRTGVMPEPVHSQAVTPVPCGPPLSPVTPDEGTPGIPMRPHATPVRPLTPCDKPAIPMYPGGTPVRPMTPGGIPVIPMYPGGTPVRPMIPPVPPVYPVFPPVPPMFPTVPPMFPTVPPMFPTVPPMFPTVPPMFPTVPPMFPNAPPMFPPVPPMFPPGSPFYPVNPNGSWEPTVNPWYIPGSERSAPVIPIPLQPKKPTAPEVPFTPVAPFLPVAPFRPVAPFLPVSPLNPVVPFAPGTIPMMPASPLYPLGGMPIHHQEWPELGEPAWPGVGVPESAVTQQEQNQGAPSQVIPNQGPHSRGVQEQVSPAQTPLALLVPRHDVPHQGEQRLGEPLHVVPHQGRPQRTEQTTARDPLLSEQATARDPLPSEQTTARDPLPSGRTTAESDEAW